MPDMIVSRAKLEWRSEHSLACVVVVPWDEFAATFKLTEGSADDWPVAQYADIEAFWTDKGWVITSIKNISDQSQP